MSKDKIITTQGTDKCALCMSFYVNYHPRMLVLFVMGLAGADISVQTYAF